MTVYMIHPSLTIGNNDMAVIFYDSCYQELEQHISVASISSLVALEQLHLAREDALIFFNRSDQNYADSFLAVLQEAKEVGSQIFPVAISEDMRRPPEIINGQSFDIVDELRRRRFTNSNITTLSTSLARVVISRVQPTLSNDNMRLFLSHRRLDGEEITAAFDRELRARATEIFRDLIDIKVGEDAQEVIEENLRASDAVIFLDTPKSSESTWIARELTIALSLNLPIVWVQIGNLDNRADLPVKPAGKPHFELPELDPARDEIEKDLIDEILHKVFVVSRESALRLFGQLRYLKQITRSNGAAFEELDRKNLIFKVSVPRTNYRYAQRPMTHLIQCYGRLPKTDDKKRLIDRIHELGYEPHPHFGPHYDTALLLAPFESVVNQEDPECVVDSVFEYIESLEKHLCPSAAKHQQKKRGVIISGAFPDCEPEYQHKLNDAVHAFAQAIFDRGGTVIFGAHPTFQHLIFDLGKRCRPDDFVQAIKLYISKYFITDNAIKVLSNQATVMPTADVKCNLENSLTLMRQKMINDPDALGLVAIGGKTKVGGHSAGVDEEIDIAKQKGVPVFLIGSVGGRSSEIAAEYDAQNWSYKLNGLAPKENHELMISEDYKVLAEMILSELGL